MTEQQSPRFVDARQVRRGFARAAAGYDGHAGVEREIGRRMFERLDLVRIEPRLILDLGCATGGMLPALKERYREARVLGIDATPEMLLFGRRQSARLRWLMPFLGASAASRIAADAAALPLPARSSGLLWSNLMLPWVTDPAAVIGEMHRVLEVGGLTMFTTLGPDTLKELKASFSDGKTHVQRFVDMHDIGDMLVHAGFADPVMDMEVIELTYADVDSLLRDLRAGGASCAASDRSRGLVGRRAWGEMRSNYEKRRRGGRLPATIEVIYGHAWKAEARTDAQGRSVVRVDWPKSTRR